MTCSPSNALAGEAGWVDAFQAVARAMVALTSRSLARMDGDLTLAQYRALVVLVSRGPQRTSDLADELGIASSTATRLVDRLAHKGFVDRRQGQTDRRSVWLTLTETGKQLVGEAMNRRRAELIPLLRALPHITAHGPNLVEALEAFAAAAGEPAEAQWWNQWHRSTQPPGEDRNATRAPHPTREVLR